VVNQWIYKAEGLSSTFHHASCSDEREFWMEKLSLEEHTNMVTGFDLTHILEDSHTLHRSTKLNMSTWNQELEGIKCIFHCVINDTSARVQIDHSLHYVYLHACTMHSKLPVDLCTMCSLSSSTVHSWKCAPVPVKLYMTGGQR